MEIRKTIEEFLTLVIENKIPLEDHGKLLSALDKLAYSIEHISYNFDETNYPDTPERKYQEIREKVEKRFPSLGYYKVPADISNNLEDDEIIIGDAIDDISDIVGDLKDVMWCFENTSEDDALWHYENSFRSHWGRHLRELQLYLHDRWW